MQKYLPHFSVLVAGSFWGLIGLFNNNLAAGGISSSAIVLIRNLGGLFVLALLFLFWDRTLFRIEFKHLPFFFGTGIFSVLLFSLCYFQCQRICSLAVAAILLYTAPTFVVILSAFLFRDHITRRKVIALVIAFLGCSFVTGIWSGSLSLTLHGLLLGVGSGFFYALYSIFGRYALARYKPFTVIFYTFLFASIGSLFVTDSMAVFCQLRNGNILLLGLGLVIFATILPYMFYTYGLSKLDSGKASILASIEPVIASFVGILAFGEPMNLAVIVGLSCVVCSVYILR